MHARIEALLATHEQCEIKFGHAGAHTCGGEFIGRHRYASITEARRAHLADVLAAHVRAEQAGALKAVLDVAPAYNCELLPDGREDPKMAAYVEGFHDAHEAVRQWIERGER
jgi:hypothetical protein